MKLCTTSAGKAKLTGNTGTSTSATPTSKKNTGTGATANTKATTATRPQNPVRARRPPASVTKINVTRTRRPPETDAPPGTAPVRKINGSAFLRPQRENVFVPDIPSCRTASLVQLSG